LKRGIFNSTVQKRIGAEIAEDQTNKLSEVSIEDVDEEFLDLMDVVEEEIYVNSVTGERGGPTGSEPTRYGDWERKGRTSDF